MERVAVQFVALPPMVARFLTRAVRQHPELSLLKPVETIAELPATPASAGPAVAFLGGIETEDPRLVARLFESAAVRLVAQVSTSGDVVRIHERGGTSRELAAHTAPELLNAVLRILHPPHE